MLMLDKIADAQKYRLIFGLKKNSLTLKICIFFQIEKMGKKTSLPVRSE